MVTFNDFFDAMDRTSVEKYWIDTNSPEPWLYVEFKAKSLADQYYESQTKTMPPLGFGNEWCYHTHERLGLRIDGNLLTGADEKQLRNLHLRLRNRGYRHRHSEEAFLDEFDFLPPAKCFSATLPTTDNCRRVTYEADNMENAVKVYQAMHAYYIASFGEKYFSLPTLKNVTVSMLCPVGDQGTSKEIRYRLMNRQLSPNGEETVNFDERTPLQRLLDLTFGLAHKRYMPKTSELATLFGGVAYDVSRVYPFELNEAIASGEFTSIEVNVNVRNHDHYSTAKFVYFRQQPLYVVIDGDDWDKDMFVLDDGILPDAKAWIESSHLINKPTYELIDNATIDSILE